MDIKETTEKVTKRVVRRLREDAEQDRLFRKQARDVYNKLIDYLDSGGEFSKEGGARVVRIDQFTNLEDRASNPIKIKWYDEGFDSADAKYVKAGSDPEIRLYVLGRGIFDTRSDARFVMKKRLQDNAKVFMHEYIHYLDDRRTEANIQDLASYEPGQDKKMSVYFSDDFEVNAFFQSGLAQTEELLDEPNLRQTFMQQWDSFRKFKEWFFDEHIPGPMRFNIDKEQEKRLVNRLYGFWRQEVK